MLGTCKNCLGLVKSCVYYVRPTREIHRVLPYSVDFKAPEELWNSLSKTILSKCSFIKNDTSEMTIKLESNFYAGTQNIFLIFDTDSKSHKVYTCGVVQCFVMVVISLLMESWEPFVSVLYCCFAGIGAGRVPLLGRTVHMIIKASNMWNSAHPYQLPGCPEMLLAIWSQPGPVEELTHRHSGGRFKEWF